jgi:hypothetical protein
MGKRSDFERVERDFYPTPREAVLPLLPHIPRGVRFCEPCAGDGQLVDILEHEHDAECVWASDIEPQRDNIIKADFRDLSAYELYHATKIITNPPWNRKILHPMIEHFREKGKGAWLLFDADWMHTKQSIPYLPYVNKVISVGRVKWIPNSKSTGKDNCCWYHFLPVKAYRTEFYGRTE